MSELSAKAELFLERKDTFVGGLNLSGLRADQSLECKIYRYLGIKIITSIENSISIALFQDCERHCLFKKIAGQTRQISTITIKFLLFIKTSSYTAVCGMFDCVECWTMCGMLDNVWNVGQCVECLMNVWNVG